MLNIIKQCAMIYFKCLFGMVETNFQIKASHPLLFSSQTSPIDHTSHLPFTCYSQWDSRKDEFENLFFDVYRIPYVVKLHAFSHFDKWQKS